MGPKVSPKAYDTFVEEKPERSTQREKIWSCENIARNWAHSRKRKQKEREIL